ncbi:MAG: lipoyl synthase [Deltaproteobacteria bacterium]|nr:lipoyl synthase [Deltaproteobacteria bacterium]
MDLPVLQPKSDALKPRRRLPEWLSKPFSFSEEVHDLKARLRDRGLHTVCEEARCPNLGECWSQKTATFMILGEVCTRHCGFCSVTAGKPEAVDIEEPQKIAEMISYLGLKHAVITCVARDDLEDRGAEHFVRVIETIREKQPNCAVEILTTDFDMQEPLMERVCRAKPDVFNHNLETVERLSPRVRHRASYCNSLTFLSRIKKFDSSMKTKSGMMLGLGETRSEVQQAMRDLREVGCEILTMGQYLQPTPHNLPVVDFIRPEVFKELEIFGYELGFQSVASGPFVRSSYHAGEMIRGI